MKRFITFIITCFVSVEIVTAGTGWCGNMVLWILNDSILTIKGDGTMNNYSVSWGECSTPWYKERASIKSIIIENGVKNIGDCAFYGCNQVITINIGKDVANIGNRAFDECSKLTCVNINSDAIVSNNHTYDNNLSTIFGTQVKEFMIGDEVSKIGDYAFYQDVNLLSISLPNSIKSIGNSAFSGCVSLLSIKIPEGVINIGSSAFNNCSEISSIEIPNSIVDLSNAFVGCNKLKYVLLNSNKIANNGNNFNSIFGSTVTDCIIGDSVTSIGAYKFDGNTNLISITIPNNLTNIGDYAFRGCTGLKEVHISSLKSWCAIQFQNATTSPLYYAHNLFLKNEIIKDLVIPDGVSVIGHLSFAYCDSIKTISIPKSIKDLDNRAFEGCNNIIRVNINSNEIAKKHYSISSGFLSTFGPNVKEYIIGNNVKSIGNSAFTDCSNIISITIGDSVTNIDNSAFANCVGLEKVYISNLAQWCNITFENITSNPLYYAHNLYINNELVPNIVIPNEVTSIKNYAFYNCTSMTSLTINSNLTSIGTNVFDYCYNLDSIAWNPQNFPNFKNATSAPFYHCPQIESFKFNDKVKVIPAYLCNNLNNLASIDIPRSVTKIGTKAFYGCSRITSVTIHDSIQKIEDDAFGYCENLNKLILNSNYIANQTYTDEKNLCNIFGKQITQCIIGDSVTHIGDFAFFDCSSLSILTLGKNLTTIGSWAFYGCNLSTVIIRANNFLGFVNKIQTGHGLGVAHIIIDDEVTSIGHYAFQQCENLITVSIGSGITNIGRYAFSMCYNLTTINIPQGVNIIEEGCFSDCKHLSTIVLPKNISHINQYAFDNCSGLKSIIVENINPPQLGNNVFDGVNKHIPIYVPEQSIAAYKVADGWKEFTNFLPLEATDIQIEEQVLTEPTTTGVDISWKKVEEAGTYIIEFKQNEKVISTFIFDADGVLQNIIYAAPSRGGKYTLSASEITTDGYRFTITNLESNTEYTYTITVKDVSEQPIQTYSGSFKTTSTSPTGLGTLTIDKKVGNKFIYGNQLYLRCGNKIYNAAGGLMK